MFNTAKRMLGDDDQATDAVQDAFITAFQKLNQFEGQATFGSWLKRITVNRCLDELKKRKKAMLEALTEETPEPTDDPDALEDINWEDYQLSNIRKAIDQLPDGFKMVLSMYLFEGYDHAEIGEVLNVSESTSKSQYHRAKKKLLEIIKTTYSYEAG